MAKTWEEKCSRLADLRAFDAGIFGQTSTAPRQVREFVLALAAVYNDISDYLLALELLKSVSPTPPLLRTPKLGQANAASLHAVRALLGILRELLVLIESNERARADPAFADLISALPPQVRRAWQTVCDVAEEKTSASGKLANFLVRCRNNVAFHYSPKVIAAGYMKRFVDNQREPPLISPGQDLDSTRFYFVDAAIEAELLQGGSIEQFASLLIGEASVTSDVLLAIFHIVTGFIKSRSALTPYVDDGAKPPLDAFAPLRKKVAKKRKSKRRKRS
jgi:hypothetical protein